MRKVSGKEARIHAGVIGRCIAVDTEVIHWSNCVISTLMNMKKRMVSGQTLVIDLNSKKWIAAS
jgi:hypothetical protein